MIMSTLLIGTMERLRFRVPGKVVINGSFIVLDEETCRAVALNTYLQTEATRIQCDTVEIVLDIVGREKLTCHYGRNLMCDSTDVSTYYLFKIVDAFFEITRLVPQNRIYIEMRMGDGFFVNGAGGEKTGIGSSACILVSVVYSLLRFHQEGFEKIAKSGDFKGWGEFPVFSGDLKTWLCNLDISREIVEHIVPITYLTHQAVHQKASGCDVMCCLLGSIYFSRKRCSPVEKIPRYLVLGSFGKSTPTREILKNVDLRDHKWESLRVVNRQVNECGGKENYMEYLDTMRAISSTVVPDRQYEILSNTNRYDIWGCGISGAGGDDCVWAITDDYESVNDYWKEVFSFTFVAEVVYRGITSL